MRQFIIVLLVVMGSMFAMGCDPDETVENDSFDLWCDDALCSWDLLSGKVEKTTTWHRKETGATLTGNPAAIGQRITDSMSGCYRFTVVADVPDKTSLYFEVDFLDDRTDRPDISKKVNAESWERFFVEFERPEWADTVRIILRKTGKGDVVLARVAGETIDACSDSAASVKKPDGVDCESDDECQSGLCGALSLDGFGYVCAGCESHDDCEDETVCSLEFSDNSDGFFPTCGKAGQGLLGDRCLFDEECGTGICCNAQCATCCDSDDCDAGSCKALGDRFPKQCGPKGGLAMSGTPCFSDEDCESDVCENDDDELLSICLSDGRPCMKDKDCPQYLDFLDDYLDSDACVVLGLKAGVCQ